MKFLTLTLVAVLTLATSSWAISPATKCQTAKLTEIGKYGLCLFKAEARSVKTSNDPTTVACYLKLAKKWAKAEEKAAGECPSTDEMDDLAARVGEHLVEISRLLAPVDAETLNNTVFFEIDGIGSGEVVMISGPGVQIERLLNNPEIHTDDTVGEVDYRSIVFEASEDWAANLQCFLENSLDPDILERHSGSIVITDSEEIETVRWNLYDLALIRVTTGSEGRLRYRLAHLPPNPPESPLIDRDPYSFTHVWTPPGQPGSTIESHPDKYLIQIEGIGSTYGFVADDPDAKELTFTIQGMISSNLWGWAHYHANLGHTNSDSLEARSLSVITLDDEGNELSRWNAFETVPISYEHVSGFSNPEQIIERLVLSYSLVEPAKNLADP